MHYGLHNQLDAYLKQYLARKSVNKEFSLDNTVSRSTNGGYLANNEGLYEQDEPIAKISIAAERILQRKSLEIRNKQQNWQVNLTEIEFALLFILHLAY